MVMVVSEPLAMSRQHFRHSKPVSKNGSGIEKYRTVAWLSALALPGDKGA